MNSRYLALAVLWAVLAASCSVGGNGDRPSAPQTPTSVAQTVRTVTVATSAAPSATSTAAPRVTALPTSTATNTPATATPTTGPAPTRTHNPTPTPTATRTQDQTEPSEKAWEFAARLEDALVALEDLPGYSYTVSDPAYVPGLALKGRVASPDRRDWTLYEATAPEHIVARWALVDGKAYSDVTGRWESVRELPFEQEAPISFALGYPNQLYDPYGAVTSSTQRNTRVASRPATRYDIDQNYGQELGASTQILWVAKSGGYLLRFGGVSWFGGPISVDVTPLEEAPNIATPEVGAPVFKGNPPLWRAPLLGHERLRDLRSYAFEFSDQTPGFASSVRGQISRDRGSLSGRIPAYASAVESDNPGDVKTLNVQLRYIGARVWARVDGAEWRRMPTRWMQMGPHEADIVSLLLYAPGGPPDGLLDDEYLRESNASQFGLSRWTVLPVLTQGKLVGTEVTDGARTLHYEGSIGPYSSEPADVWLDADGLYLQRAVVEESAGHGELHMRVDDVNKPFTVELPTR